MCRGSKKLAGEAVQRPLVRLRVQAGETHSRRTIKHHPKAQLNTSAICFAANTDHEQQRAQRLRKRAHALKPGRGPRSERHEREERHHLIRRRQRRVQSPPERLRFGLGRRGHAPDRRAHRREPAVLPAHADKGQPVYGPGNKMPEPDNRAHRRARLSQRDPAGDERPFCTSARANISSCSMRSRGWSPPASRPGI